MLCVSLSGTANWRRGAEVKDAPLTPQGGGRAVRPSLLSPWQSASPRARVSLFRGRLEKGSCGFWELNTDLSGRDHMAHTETVHVMDSLFHMERIPLCFAWLVFVLFLFFINAGAYDFTLSQCLLLQLSTGGIEACLACVISEKWCWRKNPLQ